MKFFNIILDILNSMQKTGKVKKEYADSFFAKGRIQLDPNELQNAKTRIKQEVSSSYLNYQNKQMTKKSMFAKPIFKFGLIAGLILILSVPVLYLIVNPKEERANNSNLAGEIAYTEGKVEYKASLDGGWIQAQDNIVLKEGSFVRVIGEGKAIVNLDDGSSLRLNSNSELKLAKLDPNHIQVSNESGELFARVVKAERGFDILTNDITFKSLGTAYKTVNTPEVIGVEVYHSKVNIIGIDQTDEILVEQGNKYYIVNQNNPDLANQVLPIDLEQISQDEFVLWNKDQDEKIAEFKGQMGVLFDLVPPVLEVAQPADNSSTENDSVIVSGTTEIGAVVTVNGENVANTEGSFSHTLALNLGANGIKVVSTDQAGNATVRNITINRNAKPTPAPTPTARITLSGVKVDGGVSLTWNVSGIDTSKGFKIVKSTSPNPVYPGNNYSYLSNGSTRSYTWNITDGVTYHFRVCQYLSNGTCGVYSNNITVTAPVKTTTQTGSVSSISLSASGNVVNWSVAGYSANGYKVVWSKTSGPTYPTRSGDKYQYFSNPSQTSSNPLEAFDGSGTYFVRVCEYLGGKCGVYSNQIQVSL